MFQILNFIGTGIRITPEFEVSPNVPLEEATATATLKINITDNPPDGRLPTVYYDGLYYSVNNTVWDRTTFLILSILEPASAASRAPRSRI
jgi:hypothetical protein